MSKKEDTKLPAIVSQPLPPAKVEHSFPLAFYQKTVDVSDFVSFLHSIDATPYAAYSFSSIGGLKQGPIKEIKPSITTIAGPKFTTYLTPSQEKESCYFVIACLVILSQKENLLKKEKLKLLIDQTLSCAENLSIPPDLAKKLKSGLNTLFNLDSIEKLKEEKDPSSLLFALRQMNLMVLIHYPELLAWVHPEGIDKYLKEDYLLELIRPDEGVSTYALLTLLKALDSICLILVEEGKGTIRVHRPTDGSVDQAAIFRSGGQFYLLGSEACS